VGILLSVPLLFSILYLLRILLISKGKHNFSFPLNVAKKVFCLFGIAVGIFLVVFIVERFIYSFIYISGFWNVFGIILSLLYLSGFFGLIFGFGQMGHGGASPKNVISELYRAVFPKNRKM
jgi:hypothetical protein